MFTQKVIRRNITLITAFAVFWVFLGALLNFHANRILGTELIDHAYPAIKPKTKENTIQFSDLTQDLKYQNHFVLAQNFDLSEILLPTALVQKQNITVSIFAKASTFNFGLRAPPLL